MSGVPRRTKAGHSWSPIISLSQRRKVCHMLLVSRFHSKRTATTAACSSSSLSRCCWTNVHHLPARPSQKSPSTFFNLIISNPWYPLDILTLYPLLGSPTFLMMIISTQTISTLRDNTLNCLLSHFRSSGRWFIVRRVMTTTKWKLSKKKTSKKDRRNQISKETADWNSREFRLGNFNLLSALQAALFHRVHQAALFHRVHQAALFHRVHQAALFHLFKI